jgi:hypothetical protein
MAKIDQISNGETGLSSRGKINNALKSVDTDVTIDGDGTSTSPLSVNASNFFQNISDAIFRIFNSIDITKILKFDLSGITTGTTRTLSIPDQDGVIALYEAPQETDLNIYIAGTTGSDVTGDGSIGLPFQTMLKAAQAVPSICSNITISFFFTEAGTYVFGDAEKAELGLKQYSSCSIVFEGTPETIETSVSFTEVSANKMLYNAVKAGVTLAENDWRGYFVEDSGKYYPISYNSAGSDNFQVEYMRGARNVTRNVVDMPVILNMSGTVDDKFLEFNFIGLPNIKFWKLTLGRTNGIFEFSTLKSFIDFNFGLKWDCDTIITGQYATHSITNSSFVGNYFNLTISNFSAIDSRNSSGNYSFTRCVIHSPNNSSNNIIRFEKSSVCELREVALIGGGGTCWGVSSGQYGVIVFSKTVIFRNMLAIVGSNNSPHQKIMNSNTEGYNNLLLFGLSYIVNYADLGTEIDIYDIEADGSFISSINKTNVTRYIDEKNGTRMSIEGTFPEIDYIEDSVSDSATNYYIIVGSVSENESIKIDYTAKRGALIEQGALMLTNINDTSIARTSEFDDVGLTIAKNINSDQIRLDVTDVLTDGNPTSLKLNISRELT